MYLKQFILILAICLLAVFCVEAIHATVPGDQLGGGSSAYMSTTNSLGEVAAAGSAAQAQSRANLGLGSASTNNTSDFVSTAASVSGAVTGSLGATSLVGGTVVGSGTAYTLTSTPTAVTLGTTSPTWTAPSSGTWILFANVQTTYSGATYIGLQSVLFKLRKTNGTATDVTDSSRGNPLGIVTLLSGLGPQVNLGPCEYAATAGDTITLFGSVSSSPGAGSMTVTSASLYGIKKQ